MSLYLEDVPLYFQSLDLPPHKERRNTAPSDTIETIAEKEAVADEPASKRIKTHKCKKRKHNGKSQGENEADANEDSNWKAQPSTQMQSWIDKVPVMLDPYKNPLNKIELQKLEAKGIKEQKLSDLYTEIKLDLEGHFKTVFEDGLLLNMPQILTDSIQERLGWSTENEEEEEDGEDKNGGQEGDASQQDGKVEESLTADEVDDEKEVGERDAEEEDISRRVGSRQRTKTAKVLKSETKDENGTFKKPARVRSMTSRQSQIQEARWFDHHMVQARDMIYENISHLLKSIVVGTQGVTWPTKPNEWELTPNPKAARQCGLCPFKAQYRKQISRHRWSKHSCHVFVCNLCGEATPEYLQLLRHVDKHIDNDGTLQFSQLYGVLTKRLLKGVAPHDSAFLNSVGLRADARPRLRKLKLTNIEYLKSKKKAKSVLAVNYNTLDCGTVYSEDTVYQCDQCASLFPTLTRLENHMKQHEQGNLDPAVTLISSYSDPDQTHNLLMLDKNLVNDYLHVLENKTLLCKLCEKKIKNKISGLEHLKENHPELCDESSNVEIDPETVRQQVDQLFYNGVPVTIEQFGAGDTVGNVLGSDTNDVQIVIHVPSQFNSATAETVVMSTKSFLSDENSSSAANKPTDEPPNGEPQQPSIEVLSPGREMLHPSGEVLPPSGESQETSAETQPSSGETQADTHTDDITDTEQCTGNFQTCVTRI